jgi:hypothetical protein
MLLRHGYGKAGSEAGLGFMREMKSHSIARKRCSTIPD